MNNTKYFDSVFYEYCEANAEYYSIYTKKPTTIIEQISKLKSRGMLIENISEAISLLTNVSYYHLSPYWKPFCLDNSDEFKPNTKLTRIIEIYRFDKELREFLLKHIAPIEVAYKTRFIDILCHARTSTTSEQRNDSFAYLNKEFFSDQKKWEKSLKKIIIEFDKSKEDYSEHHKKTYPSIMPPLWLVSEFLTLGEINHWVINLKPNLVYLNKNARNEIAKHFGLNFNIFTSFIMCLTNIRNFCAHQCRVWDRTFNNQPKSQSNPLFFLNKNMILTFKIGQKKGIYNTIVILAYCLSKIGYSKDFAKELLEIILKYRIDPLNMGFPKNWKQLPLWEETNITNSFS